MSLTLIVAVAVLILAVLAMGAAVFFTRKGKFPDGEISRNRELRKMGITCVKEEELRLWRKGKASKPCPEGGCEGCAFYSSASSTRS